VIWLRPTASLTAWLQGNGRGLRIAPGKRDLLVLDHVGNCARLGHPLTVHEWTLDGRTKRDRDAAPSVKVCPACFSCMPSARSVCPDCGHEFVVERREMEHVDGELVELPAHGRFMIGDKVAICNVRNSDYTVVSILSDDEVELKWPDLRNLVGGIYPCKTKDLILIDRPGADPRREQAQANTLEDLIAIGRRRNMKNPIGWARHVMAARGAKRGRVVA
jgi:hypothetical protein